MHEVYRPLGPQEDLDPIFEKLWNLFASGDHWRIADNAKSTLNKLIERGYRIALLSNNDSRLRQVIDECMLLIYLKTFSFQQR